MSPHLQAGNAGILEWTRTRYEKVNVVMLNQVTAQRETSATVFRRRRPREIEQTGFSTHGSSNAEIANSVCDRCIQVHQRNLVGKSRKVKTVAIYQRGGRTSFGHPLLIFVTHP
jgi:hypothetical protein